MTNIDTDDSRDWRRASWGAPEHIVRAEPNWETWSATQVATFTVRTMDGEQPAYCGINLATYPRSEAHGGDRPCARCLVGYYGDDEAD